MRKIGAKESYSRKAEVKGQVVSFSHSTLHKASNVSYLLHTSFDFAKVEPATILRLAGETLLIRWRTAFKDAETVDDAADNQSVKVAEMLKGRKPRMSKGEKAENLVAEMSQEELAALAQRIAKLQEQQKANAKG